VAEALVKVTLGERATSKANRKIKQLEVTWNLFIQDEGEHIHLASKAYIHPRHDAEARSKRGDQLGILAILVLV
jgi:hypothetical protein